jgi:hypothetical protein
LVNKQKYISALSCFLQAIDFDPHSLRKTLPTAVKEVALAMQDGKRCASVSVSLISTAHPLAATLSKIGTSSQLHHAARMVVNTAVQPVARLSG